MKYDFYDDISRNYVPKYNSRNLNDDYMLNNMLPNQFVNDIYPSNMNGNIGNNMLNNNLNLYGPYEGYVRGNAFKDQYVPYKNYQPAKISINSEQDEMLVNIGQFAFMAHDLNLYLDTHPNDQTALNSFLEYRQKTNDLINAYERKYGPLTVSGATSNKTPFNWVSNEWPWSGE